jgi:hypothetical protein
MELTVRNNVFQLYGRSSLSAPVPIWTISICKPFNDKLVTSLRINSLQTAKLH